MSEYLTVEEMAKELKVSEETVRRLIRSGKLKGIKIGKVLRVNKETYDNFISASEVTNFTNSGGRPLKAEKV
jgi:excisionase family DNA binding protein